MLIKGLSWSWKQMFLGDLKVYKAVSYTWFYKLSILSIWEFYKMNKVAFILQMIEWIMRKLKWLTQGKPPLKTKIHNFLSSVFSFLPSMLFLACCISISLGHYFIYKMFDEFPLSYEDRSIHFDEIKFSY